MRVVVTGRPTIDSIIVPAQVRAIQRWHEAQAYAAARFARLSIRTAAYRARTWARHHRLLITRRANAAIQSIRSTTNE